MPGFEYLEGNPQNVYAINRLGSTFSDAIIGMAQNRQRQQYQNQQLMMEMARMQNELMLAKQREERESAESRTRMAQEEANTGYLKAKTKGEETDIEEKGKGLLSREHLAEAVKAFVAQAQPGGDPNIARTLGDIIRESMFIMSSDAGKVPQNLSMMMSMGDPKMRSMMATGTPMVQSIGASGSFLPYSGKVVPPMAHPLPREQMLFNQQRSAAEMMRAARTGRRADAPTEELARRQYFDASQQLQGQVKIRRKKDGKIGYAPANWQSEPDADEYEAVEPTVSTTPGDNTISPF